MNSYYYIVSINNPYQTTNLYWKMISYIDSHDDTYLYTDIPISFNVILLLMDPFFDTSVSQSIILLPFQHPIVSVSGHIVISVAI